MTCFVNLVRLSAAAACFAVLCAGCSDGTPIVMKSQQYESPDRKLIATLEELDNGLGFGLGALYDEVHITMRSEAISHHGSASASVVFYAESTYGKGKPVTVRWLDANRLQISYDAQETPRKRLSSSRAVSIEYESL